MSLKRHQLCLMKDKSCFVCKWGVTILFASKVLFQHLQKQILWFATAMIWDISHWSSSGQLFWKEWRTVHFNSRRSHFKSKRKRNRGKWYCLPCVLWRTRLDEHNWSMLIIDQYIELCFWHSKLRYSVLKCDIRTLNKSTGQTRWLVYFWGIVRQWT